jgi:hypothetical protein
VAVEADAGLGWRKYVGLKGARDAWELFKRTPSALVYLVRLKVGTADAGPGHCFGY